MKKIEAMMKQHGLTEENVLSLVEYAMKDKAYRKEHHKKYNSARKEALKLAMERLGVSSIKDLVPTK